MRVVWCSDYSQKAMPTGFSRASNYILRHLKEKGHEVVEVAVGYDGYGDETPWKTYPTTAYGGRLEGQDIAPAVAQNCGADVLVLFMDPPDAAWALQYADRKSVPLRPHIIEALDRRTYSLCLYAPVDGCCIDGGPPSAWKTVFGGMNSFDSFASPSVFGAQQLAIASGRTCAHLPHGVDPEKFNPGGPQDAANARMLFGIPDGNFVILYVGVNKRRKQIPALFESVAKLQILRPELKITLMMVTDEREDHYDLGGLADSYKVEANGAHVLVIRNLTDPGLSMAYKAAGAFGVYLHPVGGEGFGIPVIEAQASRLPALVTAYSSLPEIVPQEVKGIDAPDWSLLPPSVVMPLPFNNIAWAWPDTDTAARRMAEFSDEKNKYLRLQVRNAAFENSKRFFWPAVLPSVEEWLQDAANLRKRARARMRVESISI